MQIRYVGDVVDCVRAVVVFHNSHKVEPYLRLYGVHLNVVVYRLREVANLFACEGFLGRGQRSDMACLDLHEVVVTIVSEGHKVNLVGRGAPIALDNNVTMLSEPLHCRLLALGTYA